MYKAFANNGQPKREQYHNSDVRTPVVSSWCEQLWSHKKVPAFGDLLSHVKQRYGIIDDRPSSNDNSSLLPLISSLVLIVRSMVGV